jgi:hypothetical protein
MKRRHFLRGVYVACGIVLCIALAIILHTAVSYDGTCGGFLPALAGPRPCSLFKYVFGTTLLLALLLGATYWPVVLAVLLLPPFVGYLIDRRS